MTFLINIFRNYSTKNIKRLSKQDRKLIHLSDIEIQILIGILLGDGHIEQRTLTSNSRLMYTQSNKHSEYFDFIFNIFNKYCTNDY